MARGGTSLAIAACLTVPAVALLGTSTGRRIAGGDFQQLFSVAAPALLLATALLVARRPSTRLARSRLAGAGIAVAGTAAAFEAARLISGWWLIVGRGLKLEPVFLATTGIAGLALVGGFAALVTGSKQARPGGGHTVPVLLGAATIAVPILPWFLLVGDGAAVIVFDDLAEPAFSAFPGDPATLAALGILLSGLVLALLSTLARPDPGRGGRIADGVAGVGLVLVLCGYGFYLARGIELHRRFPEGALWPGLNVAPLLLAGVATWAHLRAHRAREASATVFAPRPEEP